MAAADQSFDISDRDIEPHGDDDSSFDVEIKGCSFHWAQAVWRHVQDAGLAETYRKRIG